MCVRVCCECVWECVPGCGCVCVFAELIGQRLTALASELDAASSDFTALVSFYCEDPTATTTEAFFGVFDGFVRQFQV